MPRTPKTIGSISQEGLPQRDSPGDHGVRGPDYRWLTLVAMCFAVFIAMLDNLVVNVALAQIQHRLHATISGLQWVIAIYTLAFGCSLLTFGTVGDRWGRKKLFIAGVALFLVSSAACASAANVGELVVFRGIQGIAGAMFFPMTLAIIRHAYPGRKDGTMALGVWSIAGGAAVTVAPLIGGALVDTFDWRAVFLVNLPVGAVGLLLAARYVTESKSRTPVNMDPGGQAAAAVAFGSLIYSLIEGNQLGWTSTSVIAGLAVGALSLAVLIILEVRADSPMFNISIFKRIDLVASNAATFFLFFSVFALLFFVSIFLQEVRGYSAFHAGLRFLPATLGIAAAAPLASLLSVKLGSRVPIVSGFALMAAAVALLTRVGQTTSYTQYWWVLMILGLGTGLVLVPSSANVLDALPADGAGVAGATVTASRELGGAFGIGILGAVLIGQMGSSIGLRLAAVHVPVALRQGFVHLIVNDALDGSVPGGGSNPAAALARSSFVTGMHLALGVGAAVLTVAGAISYFGLGSSNRDMATAGPHPLEEPFGVGDEAMANHPQLSNHPQFPNHPVLAIDPGATERS